MNTLSLRTRLVSARNVFGPTRMINHSTSLLQGDINHYYWWHSAFWSLFRLEESRSASLREGLHSGLSPFFCLVGTSHIFIFLLTDIQGQAIPVDTKVFCPCQKNTHKPYLTCMLSFSNELFTLTHKVIIPLFFFFYCISSSIPCCSYCFPDFKVFCE